MEKVSRLYLTWYSTMASAFYVFFLFLCLGTGFAEVELPPPQNVTIMALNTNYTLSWVWDQSTTQGHQVTFTTEFIGMYRLKKKTPKWHTACEQTSQMSCDLTKHLNYLAIYEIRVRANVNDWHSAWIQKRFHPDEDAALGPPSKVNISVVGSDLEVSILDPMTSEKTSMREHLHKLYFHIMYWEHSADPQAIQPQVLETEANVVILPNLKPWTLYCVRVQSRSESKVVKHSTFTSPLCQQAEGAVPWWQIFLYFLLALVIGFLIMLSAVYGSFWCYNFLKSTFYPSAKLPSYFNDYNCDSPQSDVPKLLTPDSKSELVCDRVTVCTEPALLEIHNPPPEDPLVNYPVFEPDTSGRHSRQSSGGSEDSGVYSTKGSSGLKQISSRQSEESWQIPCDTELVKLHDVGPGLESRRLIMDEGIDDMSV